MMFEVRPFDLRGPCLIYAAQARMIQCTCTIRLRACWDAGLQSQIRSGHSTGVLPGSASLGPGPGPDTAAGHQHHLTTHRRVHVRLQVHGSYQSLRRAEAASGCNVRGSRRELGFLDQPNDGRTIQVHCISQKQDQKTVENGRGSVAPRTSAGEKARTTAPTMMEGAARRRREMPAVVFSGEPLPESVMANCAPRRPLSIRPRAASGGDGMGFFGGKRKRTAHTSS
jgi:hypothetical protein